LFHRNIVRDIAFNGQFINTAQKEVKSSQAPNRIGSEPKSSASVTFFVSVFKE
jgi:hypothetical protein